jgi:hypothetical protein
MEDVRQPLHPVVAKEHRRLVAIDEYLNETKSAGARTSLVGNLTPARSPAYAASLRDTNSVKSRTRFVLRVSPCVRSQTVPYMCRLAPGTLTSRGSASPTKHGSVVIPSPCRTATSAPPCP